MKHAVGRTQTQQQLRCGGGGAAPRLLRACGVGRRGSRDRSRGVLVATSASSTTTTATTATTQSHDCDVVVVGAGIGGLSCAALLARYGLQVTVCESHAIAGGAAHAWQAKGYHFESGPSLYSGMDGTGPAANPLAHVLQAIGEELDLIKYDTWNVLLPEGTHLTRELWFGWSVGGGQGGVLERTLAGGGVRKDSMAFNMRR
jgi:hypothetical protein